jgi:hypothetical protein
MKERFLDYNFNRESEELLRSINIILVNYAEQGYRLSVRQAYYQLVSKALITNTEKSYKKIVNLVSNARLSGLIDWKMIEDRNRETITPAMWQDPAQIVQAAAAQFYIDRWADQPNHIEVMVEKAALEGILIPVCTKWGVRFTSCRGYNSQSVMYEIGSRISEVIKNDKAAHILYLGDHDPSGIDMTRDVRERLVLFSRCNDYDLTIHRLALNYDQVEEWQPPENPAKQTDSRFESYRNQFGSSSWELDAVDPATLADLTEKAIINFCDETLYLKQVSREKKMRDELYLFAKNYSGKGKRNDTF